jgi:hypothetical protein
MKLSMEQMHRDARSEERSAAATAPDVIRAAAGDESGYLDAVDRRLLDTFPASDAVARY